MQVKFKGRKNVVCARVGGANTTPFLAAHFAKRNTKNCGGEKRSGESEGGQKFLPPNPLPFCPPERSVLVLPRFARQSVGILFKMSSDFFQQTPPKFICRRISLARRFAPRFGGHFRKEMPRVFEINCQFSRRKAVVHKFKNLYCGKAAMSRWFSSAFSGIQNEILINCRCKALPFIKLKTSKNYD
ncbi:MAG TPA: hypothetical protein PKX30_01340 [Candidatus Pacearchaeota archaeon]|nr:hypothetical protein [Candidatus Pacearchaeota archaeon]